MESYFFCQDYYYKNQILVYIYILIKVLIDNKI